MNYSEKLKDPRWQKKRLEILERDEWACKRCGNNEKTLHVHHKKYHKEPWNAKNEDLRTLCEECHKVEPNRISAIKWTQEYLQDYSYQSLGTLSSILQEVKEAEEYQPEETLKDISNILRYSEIFHFAAFIASLDQRITALEDRDG